MAKLKMVEPLVEEALINNKSCRGDNFILYLEVLKKYIDLNLSIKDVFLNHDLLGIPSLESITRARRKLQEKHPELKDVQAALIREQEEEAYIDYSRS